MQRQGAACAAPQLPRFSSDAAAIKNGTLNQGAVFAFTSARLTARDRQRIHQRAFCLLVSKGRRVSSHITLIMPNANATPMPRSQLKYHITNSCYPYS
jgi:hypothetical protein